MNLSIFPKIFRFLSFRQHQITPLGRWSVVKCDKQALFDSGRASEDHCGDIICGFPKPQNDCNHEDNPRERTRV